MWLGWVPGLLIKEHESAAQGKRRAALILSLTFGVCGFCVSVVPDLPALPA